ncbi:MAG: 4-hydroxythreonine-4-phosphate dehydrogenase PdxA [candidate division Zixibacteria bacterium]|nr:4-hydroxythreonine-4-phosphate dehydrogenase PdxA [candidate division Zixibacteria bacterium]
MYKKPIIGITMGDPAGIGPEVVVKSVTDNGIVQACHPLIFGSYPIIFSAAKRFLGKASVRKTVWPEDVRDSQGCLNVLACTNLDHRKIKTGRITRISGRMAADSVFCAAQLALSDQIDAMVTAPLSKKGLRLAGYDFPGHTELLAYLCTARSYAMMFVSKTYKVVLVTTHLPLADVAKSISKRKILGKLVVTKQALQRYFGSKNPKIAVCALNPHCGEDGILGSEERRIIIPAIKAARKMRIRAYGPFSSDTIFSSRVSKDFDCILAMYHDQGLIPLKMGGFGGAVNVTVGLPIIRTSPDFGTALDIAGKGLADPEGMTNAILLAAQMADKTKRK